MTNPQVTILIPNYKTLELTKLCLRLIRKHTDLNQAKVLVIDNDSQDSSLDYLRTLSWIALIERKSIPGESPALSHSRALDLALACVTTPYVLSIHTDTLVRNKDWLPFLLQQIKKHPNIAGVGSWKLESKPAWKNILKSLERITQRIFYRVSGKENHAIEGLDHNHFYLRSHCALYRTDLIRQYQLSFADGEEVAGKAMHRKLIAQGHDMIFLASDVLFAYMDHINHATTVLNPELSRREKSVTKGLRRIEKSLASFNSHQILQDESLDR
jgi:glycosyltransferase involved in cell wall biosynthesis